MIWIITIKNKNSIRITRKAARVVRSIGMGFSKDLEKIREIATYDR